MFSSRLVSRGLVAAIVAATVSCADAPLPTSPSASLGPGGFDLASLSEGRGAFQRYVAMGTSLSMGVASDGTIEASQVYSWPAQLARMAHREITQPYIGGTGCRSPLQTSLGTGVRISGEPAAASPATLSCGPLVSGEISLVQNVAINGALVRDALFTTPENITDAGNAQITARVLLPGHTQLSSMEEQNPKFVSLEFGANELLSVRSGIAIPGVTLFPYSVWATLYTQLVDRAAAATKYGLIVGLIHDVATVPGFRRGSEIYAQRGAFAAAFNVAVAEDCNGSDNLIFAPARIPLAAGTGLAMKRKGLGPYPFSCAAGPANVQDYVLSSSEIATVNAQASQMTDYMRAEAERVGFAFFDLDVLFNAANKPPLDVVAVVTSGQPFGPYSSLDGVHPSALGQRVVAEAAARAIDARYNFGITTELVASR